MQPDNALFGCRMLSSFISVVSAFIGDRLQRRHRGDRGLARKKSIPPVYTRHTSSFMCVGGKLLGPSLGLAPSGLAQALFKTVNHFILQLELFRGYAGRHKP
ncbi:hypothetical protein GCY28_08690 [Salmonella enterica subsp. enterica]|nr:hypothetical protein [Salmonella enterica subsp. enterica]EDH3763575.1 hypothetical protein [Salmonella enterica subsp. enterica]